MDQCSAHARGNCQDCLEKLNISCRGFCSQGLARFEESKKKEIDFFETIKCKRAVSKEEDEYPAMCQEHGILFNLNNKWINLDKKLQEFIYFLIYPELFSPALLLVAIRDQNFNFEEVVEFMFSDIGFWTLDANIMSQLIFITLNYIVEKNKGLTQGFDDTASYIFVFDMILKNVQFFINGDEDFARLGLKFSNDMISIKMRKITDILIGAFSQCFVPIKIIPYLQNNWKEKWIGRRQEWIDEHELDPSQQELLTYHTNALMTNLNFLKAVDHGIDDSKVIEEIATKAYKNIVDFINPDHTSPDPDFDRDRKEPSAPFPPSLKRKIPNSKYKSKRL